MDLDGFIYEMLVLYSIGIVGFVMRRFIMLNESTNDVLSRLILNITLPSLIIFTLDIPYSLHLIGEFLWLIVMSLYILILSILLATWLGKRADLQNKQRQVYESLIIFGNQGFIGYSVVFILFGSEGLVYLVIFNICYLILIWTYGIFIFTKHSLLNIKSILNAGFISTVFGVILLLTPLKLPSLISDTLEAVGGMTVPLSMMFIGSLIATINFKEVIKMVKNIHIWVAALLKLIIIPLLMFPFLLFSAPLQLLLIAFVVSGMPSAPTVSLYAQKYKGDASFASIGVFISTILCLVTIPLLLLIFNMFT